jgi:hypothetical protein
MVMRRCGLAVSCSECLAWAEAPCPEWEDEEDLADELADLDDQADEEDDGPDDYGDSSAWI